MDYKALIGQLKAHPVGAVMAESGLSHSTVSKVLAEPEYLPTLRTIHKLERALYQLENKHELSTKSEKANR